MTNATWTNAAGNRVGKRPDTPCSGCGRMLYSSPHSLPADRRLCQPCRRAGRLEASSGQETKTTTYPCKGCGETVTRPPTKGQRPKWCDECRGKYLKERTCSCGATFIAQAWTPRCPGCALANPIVPGRRHSDPQRKPKPPASPPIDQRSALRKAYEDGTPDDFLDTVRNGCEVDDDGCWIWQGGLKDGYAQVRIARKTLQLHRLTLEASLRAPLGSQAAHHTCAKPACVNPAHLQPVTHRNNVAEMLARQSYLSRIRELEKALGSVAPGHPLLTLVPVA